MKPINAVMCCVNIDISYQIYTNWDFRGWKWDNMPPTVLNHPELCKAKSNILYSQPFGSYLQE